MKSSLVPRIAPHIGRVTLTVAGLALCLSSCGSGDPVVSTTTAAAGQAGSAPQMREQPGSGKVAAVNGSTAQVQGPDGQTAVSWTSSTTFTQQVDGTLADVTVGSCVMVMSGESATDDSSTVAASTVRVTPAGDDGTCTAGPGGAGGPGGMGGMAGERPEGMPTDLPSGMPTDMPSGMPSGAPRGLGGFVSGEVTAVTATGFTVDAVAPGSEDSTSRKVTVSDDTTFTTTAAAKASDVKVGACVATRGDTDGTGAVTATSMQISEAVDGACTMGGGMRRMGTNP